MKIDMVKTHEQKERCHPTRVEHNTYLHTPVFTDNNMVTAIVLIVMKHMANDRAPSYFLALGLFVMLILYFTFVCCNAFLFLWMSGNCHRMPLIDGFCILRAAPWDILLFITIYTRNSRSYHQADYGARLRIKGYIFYQF